MSRIINEIKLIENLQIIAGEGSLGLTDDCAIFGEYCITKDLLSEGVHFFKDDGAYNLARKILRVNLSDLAAMGAKPYGVLIGAAFSKQVKESWIAEFNQGLKSDLEQYNCQLLGGDTVFHEAPTVFSVTAIGTAPKPLLRSNARVGDNIFVSGNIGDSFIGLQAKLAGDENSKFIEKYELPNPRIELGIKLREIANSCMDISDGLLIDLHKLCKASGVGANLFSKQIPISTSEYDLIDLISAGDDYELLFTSPEKQISGCYKVGEIISEEGLRLDGELVEPKGYIHS